MATILNILYPRKLSLHNNSKMSGPSTADRDRRENTYSPNRRVILKWTSEMPKMDVQLAANLEIPVEFS
jgi:hypothetical protein